MRHKVLAIIKTNTEALEKIRKCAYLGRTYTGTLPLRITALSQSKSSLVLPFMGDPVRLKTQLVIDQNLGGIMFWQLRHDTKEEASLVEAIYQTEK